MLSVHTPTKMSKNADVAQTTVVVSSVPDPRTRTNVPR
jgi:hypothetical protein